MLPEAPQPYGLLYYPCIGIQTFSSSSALPRPLNRESLSRNRVIQMFPTFATSRLRQILPATGGIMWEINGR
jgi:hypothetical protein